MIPKRIRFNAHIYTEYASWGFDLQLPSIPRTPEGIQAAAEVIKKARRKAELLS